MTEIRISAGLKYYLDGIRATRPDVADANEQVIWNNMAVARATIARMDPGPDRARRLHELISGLYTKAMMAPATCSKGCSACCYLVPRVQREEVQLIVQEMKEHGPVIDMDLLREAAAECDDKGAWDKKRKPCVFLKDGACSIYQNRPQICRNHNVVSNPIHCNASQLGGKTMPIIAEWPELWLSAWMNESETGWLAPMLLEEMQNERRRSEPGNRPEDDRCAGADAPVG